MLDALIGFSIYNGNNKLTTQSQPRISNVLLSPVAAVLPQKRQSRKKAKSIVPSHVLMVMPLMSNVALAVTAANYSQHSHRCELSATHSFKGTTDTQLTTFESLSTRT